MNTAHLENNIVAGCLENLRTYLGKNAAARMHPLGDRGPDFELALPTQPPIALAGECKANIATRAQALHTILQARAHGGKNAEVIIFAKWIPEVVAAELRKAGVDFADTVGNAYLRHPPQVLIDVRGKRPETRQAAQPGRLVEVGGLKLCHLLLTQPQLLNYPLRTLAEKANVGLGTVHIVLKELTLARLLRPGPGRGHHFNAINPFDTLIDTFVRGYALKLRPACLLGRFRHQKNRPAEVLAAIEERLTNTQAQWALTGGLAAKQMTGHLEPDNMALFVDEQAEHHLKAEPMLPDANGNVTLLRLFAPTAVEEQKKPGPPLATPLLVYAELLNDGGAREVETAKMIYEKWFDLGNDRWKANLKK